MATRLSSVPRGDPKSENDPSGRSLVTRLNEALALSRSEGNRPLATLLEAARELAIAQPPASLRTAAPSEIAPPLVPNLRVYVLQPFRVEVDGAPIEDWSSSRAKALFKAMLLDPGHPQSREGLMDRYWPEMDARAARMNLNVALYNLRSVFRRVHPTFPFIVREADCYVLNRQLPIWIDAGEHRRLCQLASQLECEGKIVEAISCLESCVALYRNDLLAEDVFDDTFQAYRARLRDAHLDVLQRLSKHYFDAGDFSRCVDRCRSWLIVDHCSEPAHRLLMRCHASLGQPHRISEQYRECVRLLARELGAMVSTETATLYRTLMQRFVP